jgi:hypothetical protein
MLRFAAWRPATPLFGKWTIPNIDPRKAGPLFALIARALDEWSATPVRAAATIWIGTVNRKTALSVLAGDGAVAQHSGALMDGCGDEVFQRAEPVRFHRVGMSHPGFFVPRRCVKLVS